MLVGVLADTVLPPTLCPLTLSCPPRSLCPLQVNVREARDALQQHLQQLSPAALGTNDPPAQAAIREAQQLLGEVSAVF